MKIFIAKSDGKICYLTSDSVLIISEKNNAEIKNAGLKDEKAFSIKQPFELSKDEGIYGQGQHQDGYMNYQRRQVKLVQTNTNAVTPFLISTNGYGILWDNYSKTIFEDTNRSASIWSDVSNSIDYYFIYGNNMDCVISGYRVLTGQAPMYGKWAYGYWQSKEHYKNRDELLNIAQVSQTAKYQSTILFRTGITGIIGNWRQLFFDEKLYPNPKEMIDIFHKNNFHVMISIWAGLGPQTPVYKEMEKNGFFYKPVGWAGFKYYDAYNPAANDIYWKYKKGLFSTGIDGWWTDSTEPDIINADTKNPKNMK